MKFSMDKLNLLSKQNAWVRALWLSPGLRSATSIADLVTDILVIWQLFKSRKVLYFWLSMGILILFYAVIAFSYSYRLVVGHRRLIKGWIPLVILSAILAIILTPLFAVMDVLLLIRMTFDCFWLLFTCFPEESLLSTGVGYAKPHMLFKRKAAEMVFESIPQLVVQGCALVYCRGIVSLTSIIVSVFVSFFSFVWTCFSLYSFCKYGNLSWWELISILSDTPRNVGIGHLMIDTFRKRDIVKNIEVTFAETEVVTTKYDFRHWMHGNVGRGLEKVVLVLEIEDRGLWDMGPGAIEDLIRFLTFLSRDELYIRELQVDLYSKEILSKVLLDAILQFIHVKEVRETTVNYFGMDSSSMTQSVAWSSVMQADLESRRFPNPVRKVQVNINAIYSVGFARAE